MNVVERPRVDAAHAERLAAEHYRLRVDATPLASERDRTFRLDGDDARYVLKIAHPAERREDLDLQHTAMDRLARGPDAGLFPQPIANARGERLSEIIADDGRSHLAQLLTWLPGRPYAEAGPADAAGLNAIGRTLGAMDRTLGALDHPATDRALQWDARRAPTTIRARLGDIATPGRRSLAESALARAETCLADHGPGLRLAPIHNDVNDHNLLLDERGAIAGIIDFGDLLRSYLVAELAHCAAYLMLEAPDPLTVLGELRAGYITAYRLHDAEEAALLDLVRLRLCLSVSISARQAVQDPDSRYLRISEAPAWELLDRLTPPRA
jgi:Ser/Thr protein kinase RdoA (MazF antagonist)